ncbi:hypothetical protein AKJ16_DCAP07701 [Drosera capensis]
MQDEEQPSLSSSSSDSPSEEESESSCSNGAAVAWRGGGGFERKYKGCCRRKRRRLMREARIEKAKTKTKNSGPHFHYLYEDWYDPPKMESRMRSTSELLLQAIIIVSRQLLILLIKAESAAIKYKGHGCDSCIIESDETMQCHVILGVVELVTTRPNTKVATDLLLVIVIVIGSAPPKLGSSPMGSSNTESPIEYWARPGQACNQEGIQQSMGTTGGGFLIQQLITLKRAVYLQQKFLNWRCRYSLSWAAAGTHSLFI